MILEKLFKMKVLKASHYTLENKLTSLINVKILSTLTLSNNVFMSDTWFKRDLIMLFVYTHINIIRLHYNNRT